MLCIFRGLGMQSTCASASWSHVCIRIQAAWKSNGNAPSPSPPPPPTRADAATPPPTRAGGAAAAVPVVLLSSGDKGTSGSWADRIHVGILKNYCARVPRVCLNLMEL